MTFDQFWTAYPRRIGKGYCRAVYIEITTTGKWVKRNGEKWFVQGTEEQIDTAAKAYARKVDRDGTPEKYIPHPSTWLHEGRFEDDHGEEPKSQRELHLEAKINKDLWLPSWGPEPTMDKARQELGRPLLRIVGD